MEIKLDVAQNCSGNHKIIDGNELGMIEMDKQPFLNLHKGTVQHC